MADSMAGFSAGLRRTKGCQPRARDQAGDGAQRIDNAAFSVSGRSAASALAAWR